MIAVTGTDAILLLQVLVCRRHATEHYCFNHQSLDLYCANSAHDAGKFCLINAAGSNPAPTAAFDVTITLIVAAAAAAAAAAVATKTVAAKYCRLVVPRCC